MIKRIITAVVVLVYFFTNSAFAHVIETSFWDERRHSISPSPVAVAPANQNPSIRQFGNLLSAQDVKNGGVLHIQDVHENTEAQTNISRTLQSLIDEKRVDLIALEGAVGPVDLAAFQQFSNRAAVRLVADKLLAKNKISGPIHAAMISKYAHRVAIVGIDDRLHYDANVVAAKEALNETPALKARLANEAQTLEGKKIRMFNPALREFDSRVASHKRGELPFGTYVENMAQQGNAGPATRTYLDALALESKIDTSRVEDERTKLINRLVAAISEGDKKILLELSSAFQSGRINHGDFYNALSILCEKNGVALNKYPNMAAYTRYVLLSQNVDADQLLRETRELEKGIYNKLATTPSEKYLVAQINRLELKNKLVNLALTKSEWTEYKAKREVELKSFETFYEEAEARDQIMAENVALAIKTYHSKNPVLVTGGFHARGMRTHLAKANIGVNLFVPKLTKIDTADGSAYLSVFSQEKTPLEKLFEGEKLFLAKPPLSEANRFHTAAWMATVATQMGSTIESVQRFFDTAINGWTLENLALAGASANLTLHSPRSHMVHMSINSNSGDMEPRKKITSLVPDIDKWMDLYERIKNAPLPNIDIRETMSEEERQSVTRIIYPAARYDTQTIGGLLKAFPNVTEFFLIDPVYTDHHFEEATKREFKESNPDVNLIFKAENYLQMLPLPTPTQGRVLLIDKWPGTDGMLRKNPAYRKAILRDVRPADFVLAHQFPRDSDELIKLKILKVPQTSLPAPFMEQNKFVLWQVSDDDYETDPNTVNFEIIRTNPKDTLRQKALRSLTPGLIGDDFLRTMLYAFSDPSWKIRQEATSAIFISPQENRLELLLNLLRNPDVPINSDPRMSNAPYSAERARRNARLAVFWTIQKMLSAKQIDTNILRGELTVADEKALSKRVHRFLTENPNNPLGTSEPLSFLEAAIICSLWYGHVVHSTAKLESERDWDDEDVADAQRKMNALSSLTETVASIIDELYPSGDIRRPHLLHDARIMIYSGHILTESDTHNFLKTWPSGAEPYLDMVVPGKSVYPSSIVYSLLNRYAPYLADEWASAISLASLAMEIPGIFWIVIHFDFVTSSVLLTLFALAHGTRGSPLSHIRVFGLYLFVQPLSNINPLLGLIPIVHHLANDVLILWDKLSRIVPWEEPVFANILQFSGHKSNRRKEHHRQPGKLPQKKIVSSKKIPAIEATEEASQELADIFDRSVNESTVREKLKKKLHSIPKQVKAAVVLSANYLRAIPGVAMTLPELGRVEYYLASARERYMKRREELDKARAAKKYKDDVDEKRRLQKRATEQVAKKQFSDAAQSLLTAAKLVIEPRQLTFNVWRDIARLYTDHDHSTRTFMEQAVVILKGALEQISAWSDRIHPLNKTYASELRAAQANMLQHMGKTFAALRILANDPYDLKIADEFEGNERAEQMWERIHNSAEAFVLRPAAEEEDYLLSILDITGQSFASLHIYGLLIRQKLPIVKTRLRTSRRARAGQMPWTL
jgi:hypothetical protein